MSNAEPLNSKRTDWAPVIPKSLQTLVAQIMENYPFAKFELYPMPSGVCFLDVQIGERMFQLEYCPGRGAGVSEIHDDTPPFTGHDQAFATLDEGVDCFKQLVNEAARTEPLPRPYVPAIALQPA